MAKNKLVLRVNICFSNFGRKILDEIPIEEQEKWIFEYDDNDIENSKIHRESLVRMRSTRLYFGAL